MSIHPSVSPILKFARLLIASGLLDTAACDSLVEDFEKNYAPSSKYGNSLTAFGTYLVANKVLTCWQFTMLNEGRWKGFFLDQFKLIDCIGHFDKGNRYIAEDLKTGEVVVLAVTSQTEIPRQNGKPHYTVEPFVK